METSGPGNEIKFELDLRSRTMTLSINSRIQGVTFSDISASVSIVRENLSFHNSHPFQLSST